MKRILLVVTVLSFSLVNSGCVPVFFAAAGGVGVYAAGKDTIQGESDVPYETVWDSAVTVAKVRGTITKQEFDRGAIEAMEGKSTKVWICVEKVTASTSRLKVASRKYKMPNLELAQIIYTKVLDQAKSGPARETYRETYPK
jgi:hypothetical protein